MAADVWDLYAEVGEQDRADLPAVQQAVLAICDLRQEVNAGGFDSYLRHWGGDTAPQALAALPAALGQDWADLLREAMATLGRTYPTDADTRAAALDEADADDRLDELNERFQDLEGDVDADARLAEHLADGDA